MPQAISVPIRKQIVQFRKAGQTIAAIAERLALSPWSVRTLARRYQSTDEADLQPNYHNCGRHSSSFDPRLRRGARWLKRHHPKWGAGLIAVVIQRRWLLLKMPSIRTVQRWLQDYQPSRTKVASPPGMNRVRATSVHQVWQLDATSHQRLADGTGVSWLTLTDEASGAHLFSRAFSPLHF